MWESVGQTGQALKSVVGGRWSVVGGQLSVVCGQLKLVEFYRNPAFWHVGKCGTNGTEALLGELEHVVKQEFDALRLDYVAAYFQEYVRSVDDLIHRASAELVCEGFPNIIAFI